jgi:hypothetical protein
MKHKHKQKSLTRKQYTHPPLLDDLFLGTAHNGTIDFSSESQTTKGFSKMSSEGREVTHHQCFA